MSIRIKDQAQPFRLGKGAEVRTDESLAALEKTLAREIPKAQALLAGIRKELKQRKKPRTP
jgi:hypothetical protein